MGGGALTAARVVVMLPYMVTKIPRFYEKFALRHRPPPTKALAIRLYKILL